MSTEQQPPPPGYGAPPTGYSAPPPAPAYAAAPPAYAAPPQAPAPVAAQYPPPAPAYAPQPGYAQIVYQAKNNGMAIASLVLGITWIYWIGSVLAVIFGHVALSQINKSNGTQTGRGMAIAGLVLGYVGVAVLAIVLIAGAAASSS